MTGRLTVELLSWIGREVTYTANEPLGEASIRYFALSLGDDNPIYRDSEFARNTRHGGIIAPPTLVCETNQFYRRPVGADGYFGHRWDIPVDGDRVIRGGNEYEFHQPVRPDDVISVTWRILDIYERVAKNGESLIFVISEARYVNQRSELLAVNKDTTIR